MPLVIYRWLPGSVGGWCELGTVTTMAINVRLTAEADRVLAALAEDRKGNRLDSSP